MTGILSVAVQKGKLKGGIHCHIIGVYDKWFKEGINEVTKTILINYNYKSNKLHTMWVIVCDHKKLLY